MKNVSLGMSIQLCPGVCVGVGTCALWETWYVRISEGVLALEGVSEHAQSGPTDDCHLGAVLRLRHQPISCPLVFVMTGTQE